MKKTTLLVLLLLASALLLTGCSSGTSEDVPGEALEPVAFDVEIREKLFMAQVNDVYLNPNEYFGKTIKLEGMFATYYFAPTDSEYYMVMRNGPGCCGDDDIIGFEVAWNDAVIARPKDNDWVEAVGKLEWYVEGETAFLRLNLSSLRVLNTRGAETVLQ